jgi:hypothetical protein
MDELEFLRERSKQPSYTAAELYAMLCVADITKKELLLIIDILMNEGARFDPLQYRTINDKVVQVSNRLCGKSEVDYKSLDALRARVDDKKELLN